MGNLLMTLDIGTSSCKAAAVDAVGVKVSEFATKYETRYPQPGYAEQNPEDWIAAISSSVQKVTAELGNKSSDIIGLTVSSHGPTLVLMDEQGKAMKPAHTWQDFRCIEQGERLVHMLNDRGWIGLGGTRTGMAAKLLWARENWPEAFDACRWVLGVKEYMIYWLTGEIASEPSSGPGSRIWPKDVFGYIGLPLEKLPPVYPSIFRIGNIKANLADKLRLPKGLPVYMGLNDGASSTLGAGAFKAGHACVSLGTNGVGRLVLDKPFDSNLGYQMNAFFWPYIPQRWVVGGMTITGGSCLSWLRDCMGTPEYEKVISLAQESAAGSHGVIFLPFLNGRGTPLQNEKARAAFLNISIGNNQGDIVRSVMEGVAFSLKEIYTALFEAGFPVHDVRITGGGAQIALWRKIVCNVLNRKLVQAGGDATLGGAILSAVAGGLYADFDEAVGRMVKFIDEEEPDRDTVSAYEAVYQRYKYFIEKLGY